MKKVFLTGLLAFLTCFGFAAGPIRFGESVPEAVVPLLTQRLTTMLEAGNVAEVPLEVHAVVTDRMETSGSIAQTALAIELVLQSGELRECFILKGIGADEGDAWLRAVKQFLPHSQAARSFVERLKETMR